MEILLGRRLTFSLDEGHSCLRVPTALYLGTQPDSDCIAGQAGSRDLHVTVTIILPLKGIEPRLSSAYSVIILTDIYKFT
jgi:hypothetical protein